MFFQDGYKLVRANQLLTVLGAVNSKQITFRAFRTYFGCLEMLAIRDAAERSTGKHKGRRFFKSELSELMGEDQLPNKELLKLKRAGVLFFSESAIELSDGSTVDPETFSLLGGRGGERLVPIPRQVLKFLASCTKPALAKTVIAYVLRGLSLSKTGELKSAGTIKVSWICKLCRISERAARGARAKLISLGWITRDTASFQRKLNRDGAYFVINAAWNRVLRQIAPLKPEKGPKIAPPIERQETPKGSKNQKLYSRPRTGICKANNGEKLAHPTLGDIQMEDLKRLSRLRVLYAQAVAAKWLTHSEASLVNFVAAAARASRVKGDPIRIFVGIVKKGFWHHLTNEDEGRALAALKREKEKAFFKPVSQPSNPVAAMTESIATVVQSFGFTVGVGECGKMKAKHS